MVGQGSLKPLIGVRISTRHLHGGISVTGNTVDCGSAITGSNPVHLPLAPLVKWI